VFASRYARPTLALRARGGCAALFHSYTFDLCARSRAGRLCRLYCARRTRTPAPITCAHCPNECLYQFVSRSVQPFGRQRWICGAACTFARACMRTPVRRLPYVHGIGPMRVCANVGPNRPSRLAAYTGHVMTCARLRAHGCARALTDAPIFIA
jgi:hypothetical protein